MAIVNKGMVQLASKNSLWQKEVYRDPKVQIVLMDIPAGEEIGTETHPADQTTFIVEGEAQIVVDGHSTKAGANHLVVIPKGSSHTSSTRARARSRCSRFMRRPPSPRAWPSRPRRKPRRPKRACSPRPRTR